MMVVVPLTTVNMILMGDASKYGNSSAYVYIQIMFGISLSISHALITDDKFTIIAIT